MPKNILKQIKFHILHISIKIEYGLIIKGWYGNITLLRADELSEMQFDF